MPAKRRYNIEKKVREHNRKLKKQLRKKNSHKKAKDPGIPNSLPFKEQIIREAQEDKRNDEERRQLLRTQNKEKRDKQRDEQLSQKRKIDLIELQKDVDIRTKNFEKNNNKEEKSSDNSEINASNLKAYYREFHKVIEGSDVIIEVLDARDPIGSRCPQVEEEVIKNGANKRLILLLNKVDLIPRDNLSKWLKYLRNELPTIAFKASTQKQNSNLSRSKVNILQSSDQLLESSKCLGADILMKLLGNYCRNKDIKTSITVGIVGFPNVGKSSVINSLKRSHACSVGPTPGVTKTMQSVNLDKKIKLLDSPGIIFANNNQLESNSQSSLMALRNAVRVETLSDPISPVDALLNRVNRQDLQLFYRLPAFKDVNEFLALLAKRFGKMKKGGLLDIDSAARKVLNDWNIGKIKYFTSPPETQSLPCHLNAEIVSEMSKEFDINEYIIEQEMTEINKSISNTLKESEALNTPSFGFTSAQIEPNEEPEDMEDEEVKPSQSGQTSILIKPKKEKVSKVINDEEMKDINELKAMQLNKQKKVMFKKLKKHRKRKQKMANSLSQSLESNISLNNDSYDFDDDFK